VFGLGASGLRGPWPVAAGDRRTRKGHALLREGCFTCLQEAQTIFERLSAPPRPAPGAAKGVFEATVLIAMREPS